MSLDIQGVGSLSCVGQSATAERCKALVRDRMNGCIRVVKCQDLFPPGSREARLRHPRPLEAFLCQHRILFWSQIKPCNNLEHVGSHVPIRRWHTIVLHSELGRMLDQKRRSVDKVPIWGNQILYLEQDMIINIRLRNLCCRACWSSSPDYREVCCLESS